MAGSHSPTEVNILEHIHARLEGLKLLAHHLDEPIVIFNPQMELVYANPSADKLGKECSLLASQATSLSHLRVSKPNPCNPCPVPDLFKLSP